MEYIIGFFILSGCGVGVQLLMMARRLWQIRRINHELMCIAMCQPVWTFHGPMYNRGGLCRGRCRPCR